MISNVVESSLTGDVLMNAKVLLVDDEEQFVEILAQRLQTRGFHVETTFNGDDAIQFIGQHDMDVVILDVLMPGRDGIEVLREIKRIKPLIEVIMLTGHGTVDTAISGMKLGAYDYLMKPTDTTELVEKITKSFERKKEQEERIRQAEVDRLVKTKGW
jgi:two-component system, OmpR family, response regulator CpxR